MDLIVIGAGPAGISAAIYAKRGKTNVTVISNGESALQKAKEIDNYYGFENTISGSELYEAGIKQAKRLEIPFINGDVLNINYADNPDDGFSVRTTAGDFTAKAVIIATGTKRVKSSIKGTTKFEGSGVSYCATCDGFFHKDTDVAVLGNGSFAEAEAKHLSPIASNVYVLTNGDENPSISADEKNIKIVSQKIDDLYGENTLEGVKFADGSTIPLHGFFIALGTAGASDMAKQLGAELNEKGDITVDNDCKTSIDGLYAAGDCIGGILQASVAVGEGARAGMAASKYIRQLNK